MSAASAADGRSQAWCSWHSQPGSTLSFGSGLDFSLGYPCISLVQRFMSGPSLHVKILELRLFLMDQFVAAYCI